jgi:hypothetical protein
VVDACIHEPLDGDTKSAILEALYDVANISMAVKKYPWTCTRVRHRAFGETRVFSKI